MSPLSPIGLREPARKLYDRALRRTQNIRERLGASGSLVEPFPWKPKEMHWRTYADWYAKAKEAESRCWPTWVYTSVITS